MPLFKRLYTRNEIRRRTIELAKDIAVDNVVLGVHRPVIVPVAEGAMRFAGALAACVSFKAIVPIKVKSYKGVERVTTPQVIEEPHNIAREHIIVVEDIVDSGHTMKAVLDCLSRRHPASIRVCTLLQKPDCREVFVPLNYVGFSVPNEFVVGFGLDYNERGRNLDDIWIFRP